MIKAHFVTNMKKRGAAALQYFPSTKYLNEVSALYLNAALQTAGIFAIFEL